MDSLLQKVCRRFSSTNAERQRAVDADRALSILQHAIDHLQQYGAGRDLEFQRARIILHGRIDAVWADFGHQREESPAHVG